MSPAHSSRSSSSTLDENSPSLTSGERPDNLPPRRRRSNEVDAHVDDRTRHRFTDLVAIDEDGQIRVAKSPSTPPNFEQGVVSALEDSGIGSVETRLLYHGTTVSTNALITRSGGRTGLIATKGFRDVIELRDGSREEMSDTLWDPPPPLVPRYDRLEVTERVDHGGHVVTPLDENEV